MSSERALRRINQAIEKLERQLEQLKRIRDDRELLVLLFGSGKKNSARLPGNGNGGPTHFSVIADFFESRDNQWASAPEIMKATGLSRAAVGFVLYQGHPDRFESKPVREGSRRRLWRLARNRTGRSMEKKVEPQPRKEQAAPAEVRAPVGE